MSRYSLSQEVNKIRIPKKSSKNASVKLFPHGAEAKELIVTFRWPSTEHWLSVSPLYTVLLEKYFIQVLVARVEGNDVNLVCYEYIRCKKRRLKVEINP